MERRAGSSLGRKCSRDDIFRLLFDDWWGVLAVLLDLDQPIQKDTRKTKDGIKLAVAFSGEDLVRGRQVPPGEGIPHLALGRRLLQRPGEVRLALRRGVNRLLHAVLGVVQLHEPDLVEVEDPEFRLPPPFAVDRADLGAAEDELNVPGIRLGGPMHDGERGGHLAGHVQDVEAQGEHLVQVQAEVPERETLRRAAEIGIGRCGTEIDPHETLGIVGVAPCFGPRGGIRAVLLDQEIPSAVRLRPDPLRDQRVGRQIADCLGGVQQREEDAIGDVERLDVALGEQLVVLGDLDAGELVGFEALDDEHMGVVVVQQAHLAVQPAWVGEFVDVRDAGPDGEDGTTRAGTDLDERAVLIGHRSACHAANGESSLQLLVVMAEMERSCGAVQATASPAAAARIVALDSPIQQVIIVSPGCFRFFLGHGGHGEAHGALWWLFWGFFFFGGQVS